jgi:2,3-dihydroxybenzoate decarboxylase
MVAIIIEAFRHGFQRQYTSQHTLAESKSGVAEPQQQSGRAKAKRRYHKLSEAIKMRRVIGRREFFGKAASAAVVPLMLHGGSETAQANRKNLSAQPQQSAKAKIKRIAVEEHWGTAEFAKSQGMTPAPWIYETRLPASPEKTRAMQDLGEVRLADMDEAGITMQVVAAGWIEAQPDLSTAIDMAKKTNDNFAALIGKHPDRFAGFAALPVQDPKASADELERAVKKLGMKGTMISGLPNQEYLDAQRWRVLWERSADLGVPIYIHPADPAPNIMKMYDGRPELLGSTWAWTVETATQALRVIGSGVFDAYPNAILMLGHLGEGLPYLLGRMDGGYSSVAPKYKTLKKTISAYVQENILVTTSSGYRPEALVCAISAMGADRVLFADDYPHGNAKRAVENFEKTPMSDADREKIYHLNAERWLKL